jgi:hypothetical protein
VFSRLSLSSPHTLLPYSVARFLSEPFIFSSFLSFCRPLRQIKLCSPFPKLKLNFHLNKYRRWTTQFLEDTRNCRLKTQLQWCDYVLLSGVLMRHGVPDDQRPRDTRSKIQKMDRPKMEVSICIEQQMTRVCRSLTDRMRPDCS